MLFDSHGHLDDPQFDSDRDEVIKEILDCGVSLMVDVGADVSTSEKAVALSNEYPFLYAAVGVHPNDADTWNDETREKIRILAGQKKVVAIGETGLDYHYDEPSRDVQKKAFLAQIDLANELNLPLIIHDRDAHGDVLEILKSHPPKSCVLHCFSGSAEMAQIVTKMGYYVSFSGTVTFKNAKKVQEAAKIVPDELLLAETDCPYLCPEPFRGKRNHSGYVRYTVEKLAALRGMTFAQMANLTLQNAKRFYQLG